MGNEILTTIYLAGAFLALFGLAEILYHFLHVKAELTRKFVHLCTGFITLLFPLLLKNHWYVLALCSSFAVILVASKKFNFLPSINGIDRKSFGSLAYPISVYGCYLAFAYYSSYIFFYIPILILAIADPAAALTGKRWPYGKYSIGNETKTLVGSTAFTIVAFITSFVILKINLNITLLSASMISLALGFTTSVAEAITRKGLDNITIPLTALAVIITAHLEGIM